MEDSPCYPVRDLSAGSSNSSSIGSRAGIALLVLCLSGSMTGCQKKAGPNPLLAPPEVEVTKVITGDVPVVREWIGSIDGSYNADVRARVSGYITAQRYKDGAVVKTEDVLFEIDQRPFTAALAQAKADLSQAQADQVKTQLAADRYTSLSTQKAVSDQDRDNAVQQNEAAKARVEAQKALVQQAELNLEFTKVTAPVNGVASIANRNIGDLVGPSDPNPLVTVSTVDPVRAYFQISEQAYLKIAAKINAPQDAKVQGPPIELVLADGSDYPHKGRLVALDRQVDSSTGTIRLAAEFPNPGNILRPGQFARVRVVVAHEEAALLIPQQAVQELQGSHQVAVLDAENKVAIRLVKPGPRFGAMWVIHDGLQAGDQIVVEGLQKVANGKVVVPKPYQVATATAADTATARDSSSAPQP